MSASDEKQFIFFQLACFLIPENGSSDGRVFVIFKLRYYVYILNGKLELNRLKN